MVNKQPDFTVIQLFAIFGIFSLLLAWAVNIYQLSECDFKPDYRCEVMHGIGVFPAVAPITVWFPTDKGDKK
jgi:hypothetical protein